MDVVDDLDDRVRNLCRKIAEEPEPEKVNELCAALRRLLKVQHDTTKLSLQNIAIHYRSQMRSAQTPSTPEEEASSRIRALLTFLGLASGDAA
jgi:hypothetical protein